MRPIPTRLMPLLWGTGLLGLASCGAAAPTSSADVEYERQAAPEGRMGGNADAGEFGPAKETAKTAPMRADAPAAPAAVAAFDGLASGGAEAWGRDKDANDEKKPEEPKAAGDGDDGGGERLRSYFPEAFLWQPLVETGEDGTATVDVRVPDTLTTWRILALAHTRDGAQAGAVATFDGTLPLYVDPVVPGWLYAGDQVLLPVQVVNTTDAAISAQVSVTASGPLSGTGLARLDLPAGGSDVREVSLKASGAGTAKVQADVPGYDAAVREIPVVPKGRPVESGRGGTLSSTRSFHLAGPSGADGSTEELGVLVFPGPLAVMQAEVERAGGGAGTSPWSAAYGFALASRLESLSSAAKVDVDAKVVRKLQITAWQRVVQLTQAPDPGTAADLLAAMKDTTDNDLATQTAKRMAQTVANGQRADGTWARQDAGSLQLVLVQTAFAARALPEDQKAARLRAAGAIERHIQDVKDPYTAAVVLSTGLLDAGEAEKLRKIVTDGIVDVDGRKTVAVPADVQDPWGWRPSQAEMLAWTSLALADRADLDWKGDLAAELMSGWNASWGFGAGPADVVALDAVARALPALDKPVDVALTLDGVEVAHATLDPTQPKVPALLEAHPGGKDGEIGLKVTPEVPGLAFVATRRSWVPWTGSEALPGVDAKVTASSLKVGDDGTVTLELAAPSGVALAIDQGLPAGATVDEDMLAAYRGTLVDWTVSTDRVHLVTRPFGAGEVMEIPLHVQPAFAGTFSTVPLTLEQVGDDRTRTEIAPMTWQVAPS